MTAQLDDTSPSFLVRYQRKITLAAAAWLAFMHEHSAEPDAVERELDNVVKAARQALAEPTARAAGLTLVTEAWRHMELRGHWLPWQDTLRTAAAVATDAGAASHAARLHDQLAETERLLGNHPAALAQFEVALAAARQANDLLQAGRILSHMSQVQLALGHLDAAETSCKQALTYVEGLDVPDDLGLIYNNWGIVCKEKHDLERALEQYALAEVCFKQVQNRRGIAHVANNRGNVFHTLKIYSEAEEFLRKALTIYQELGDKLYTANTQINLSSLMFAQGQKDQALQLLIASEDEIHHLRNPLMLARLHNNRGVILAACNLTSPAEVAFQEAVQLYVNTGNSVYAIDTLQNYIHVLLDIQEVEEAAQQLAYAHEWLNKLTDPPSWLVEENFVLTNRVEQMQRTQFPH